MEEHFVYISLYQHQIYLYFINWRGGGFLEPTSSNRRPNAKLLIPNTGTSIRQTFFVVQVRFSRKPDTQQQPWPLLHGPLSSGDSRRTSL